MASLIKRKNGYYYVKYTENKKVIRISTGCRSKADANNFFRDFKPGKNEHDKMRLSDLEIKALDHARANCGDKMYSQYKNTFRHLIDILKNDTLKNIAKSDLQNYIGIREKSAKPDGSHYSKYTLNLEIPVIKKAFEIAHDKKWITENPAKKLKKFKVKSDVQPIDENILPELLDLIKNNTKNIHNYYAILIALNTGMRQMEICSLKWEQIDYTNNRVQLKNKINGETEYAYFNNTVLEIFSILKSSKIKSSEGYIWGRVLDARNLRRSFTNFKNQMGITGKVTFHSTRHTAITRWANNLNLHLAQDLARHASPNQTKAYVHTRTEQLKQAVNAGSGKI